MARGRMISRSLSTSRKRAALHAEEPSLAEFCQALYPLLVAWTDDHGRLEGDPFTVKHRIDPSSPRTLAEFEHALAVLDRVGLITCYRSGRQCVVEIVDFAKHNGLKNPAPSLLPGPESVRNADDPLSESGKAYSDRTLLPPDAHRRELNRTEENGTEGNVRAPLARVSAVPGDGFDAFWVVYPKKRSRSDAEKAWRKLAPSPELRQRIMGAIAVQRRDQRWLEQDGRYVPYPATWLNGRRWEDEVVAGRKPGVAEQYHSDGSDWFEECQRLHGGSCGGRYKHSQRKEIDAMKEPA